MLCRSSGSKVPSETIGASQGVSMSRSVGLAAGGARGAETLPWARLGLALALPPMLCDPTWLRPCLWASACLWGSGNGKIYFPGEWEGPRLRHARCGVIHVVIKKPGWCGSVGGASSPNRKVTGWTAGQGPGWVVGVVPGQQTTDHCLSLSWMFLTQIPPTPLSGINKREHMLNALLLMTDRARATQWAHCCAAPTPRRTWPSCPP